MKRKIILSGAELEAHLETTRLAAELEAKHLEALDRSRRMMQADADSDSDSDDSGDEEDRHEQEAVEPGSGVRRRTGGFTGGAGAWDEFLDPANAGAGGQSFDVYVRGAFSKRAVVDGRETLQRYRMFPVVERKRRVDAYGEAIDVEGWLKRGVEEDEFGREKVPGVTLPVLGKRTREEEEAEEVSWLGSFV
mgnify:CR=1 FL=1